MLRRLQTPLPLEQLLAIEAGAGIPAGDRTWTRAEVATQEWVDEIAVEDESLDPRIDELGARFGDAIPVVEVVLACSLVDGPVLGVSNADVVLAAEDALMELAGEPDLERALRALLERGDIVALDNGVLVGPGLELVE